MAPSLSDRLVIDSTMAASPGPEEVKVYRPKQSKAWRLGLTFIVMGLVGLLPLPQILHWLSGGPTPDSQAFLVVLCLLLVPVGILWIVNAMRGYPRLTVTPDGVSIHTGFTQRWARWDSLDPFDVMVTVTGRFNQRVLTASARVTGPNASRAAGKSFTISDFFQTPIETIAADLNAERAYALGPSHAAPAATAPVESPVGLGSVTAPWLTLTILAVLIVIFMIENMFPVTPGSAGTPSVPTLLAMGALSRATVLQYGEWYRLFTAPLLHGSVIHILSNGVALLLGGRLLERLVGPVWFFALFTVGALGGSLMSLAVNPANLVSVGVSGALMGMFAALFVSAFRLPANSPARHRLQVNAIQVLIPSLLPLFSAGSILRIDYGAHFGGALSGALMAVILLKAWPRTESLPRLQGMAAAISFLGIILFVGSAGLAAANYSQYDIALIPPAEFPKSEADRRARAADLVARYPNDPRSHFVLGEALSASKDNAGAEREFRTALLGAQAHMKVLGPQLELVSRTALAGSLADEGKLDDAKNIAKAICSAHAGNTDTDNLKKVLSGAHLCE